MNYLSNLILDPLLQQWLREDIGRGDRTTMAIFRQGCDNGKAFWLLKEQGIIAGLNIAQRVFQLLDNNVIFNSKIEEGKEYKAGTIIAEMRGKMDALLTGERVALNLVMKLSGIATLTAKYTSALHPYPTKLVDTRKTTPGLRILEKYAVTVGGGINHRFGLDDAVMIKDNHIQACGGIAEAIKAVRQQMPYPLTIEVETSNLEEVRRALEHQADIIMLDNMKPAMMTEAVTLIHHTNPFIKIEASGNVTLDNLVTIAKTGVDYISTSALITKASWLDISMKFQGRE